MSCEENVGKMLIGFVRAARCQRLKRVERVRRVKQPSYGWKGPKGSCLVRTGAQK